MKLLIEVNADSTEIVSVDLFAIVQRHARALADDLDGSPSKRYAVTVTDPSCDFLIFATGSGPTVQPTDNGTPLCPGCDRPVLAWATGPQRRAVHEDKAWHYSCLTQHGYDQVQDARERGVLS